MRRGLCKSVHGLLASSGLVLSLSSQAVAQLPSAASPVATGVPEPASRVAVPPSGFAETRPLPDAPEPIILDTGEDEQGSRWYGSAESLLWWFKDSPMPVPLLTTTSNPNSMPVAGLNDPNTSVLLGNQSLGTGVHVGGRITAGMWIDDRHEIAVEGSYFVLASKTTVRSVASNGQPGSPILAVPFFDEDAGAESSFVIAFPGNFAGAAALSLTSRLQGADILGAVLAYENNNFHFQVLAGGRFLQLTENLNYATTSTGLSDPNTDLVLNTVDQFNMRNTFYGFQVGARADYQFGKFDIRAYAKLALGEMFETANLNLRSDMLSPNTVFCRIKYRSAMQLIVAKAIDKQGVGSPWSLWSTLVTQRSNTALSGAEIPLRVCQIRVVSPPVSLSSRGACPHKILGRAARQSPSPAPTQYFYHLQLVRNFSAMVASERSPRLFAMEAAMPSFALPALPVVGLAWKSSRWTLHSHRLPLPQPHLDLPGLFDRHLADLPGRRPDVPSSTILAGFWSAQSPALPRALVRHFCLGYLFCPRIFGFAARPGGPAQR